MVFDGELALVACGRFDSREEMHARQEARQRGSVLGCFCAHDLRIGAPPRKLARAQEAPAGKFRWLMPPSAILGFGAQRGPAPSEPNRLCAEALVATAAFSRWSRNLLTCGIARVRVPVIRLAVEATGWSGKRPPL